MGADRTATNYRAKAHTTLTSQLYRTVNDDDVEILFDYELGTGSTAVTPYMDVQLRYNTSTGVRLMARFAANHTALYGWNGSAWTLLKIDYATGSTLGTEYHVRIVADGADVKVYRWTDGTAETLVLHETAAPLYNGSQVRFFARPNTENYFDNIRILADGMSQTVTYTYNANNELATMADYVANGSCAAVSLEAKLRFARDSIGDGRRANIFSRVLSDSMRTQYLDIRCFLFA